MTAQLETDTSLLCPTCHTHVDAHGANTCLSEWVARAVMGLPEMALKDAPCPECGSKMYFCGHRARCTQCGEWKYSAYLDYSESIAAAWQVVEEIVQPPSTQESAEAAINSRFLYSIGAWDLLVLSASEAALLICRAAIHAMAGRGQENA